MTSLTEHDIDPMTVLAGLVADRIITRGPEIPRLALSRQEAAAALGVSVDHFERHVLPDLRVIRSGRLVLIPVEELNRWTREQAAHALRGRQVASAGG